MDSWANFDDVDQSLLTSALLANVQPFLPKGASAPPSLAIR
jgi:hypothetical protein